jgi:hypothetical protein
MKQGEYAVETTERKDHIKIDLGKKKKRGLGFNIIQVSTARDRLCGLVVSVPGYRSGGPGSIPGPKKK